MVSQLIQQKNDLLNAALYVDYENIFQLMKRYGVNPLEINFFPVILDKLKKEYDLALVECNAYGNFGRKSFEKHQNILHNLGLQTCHTASQGKNCSDLMLTVDSLSTLYKNPHIEVFIIISSDRDMIPLLKAIKRENKITFMLTTKYGFNQAVCDCADFHEYIEDIFNLTPDMLSEEELNVEFFIKQDNLSRDDLINAKEVSKLLYSSNVWVRP